MKAFLSHSSKDKPLVGKVAEELGRQYCLYDAYAFETGDEFKSAIRCGLSQSDLFVLFASKSSVNSTWVSFELAEAEDHFLEGKMQKIQAFIIDDEVSYHDLPEWMHKTLVKRISTPRFIAREIKQRLDDLVRERQKSVFVGRNQELEQLEHKLAPTDQDIPPKSIHLWGLNGIGRRTLCHRAARNLLNLSKQIVFRVETGDDIHTLTMKAAEEIEPYNDLTELQEIIHSIKSSKEEEAIERFAQDQKNIVQNNGFPTFVDAGGLVDEDGRIAEPFRRLFTYALDMNDVYISIISVRRPSEDSLPPNTPQQRVLELKKDDIQRLMSRIAVNEGVPISAEQIDELASYVQGYPPAAKYAIELIRLYGVDYVLNEKSELIRFRANSFVRFLSGDQNLSRCRKQTLATLAFFNPLPFRVLAHVLDVTPSELSDELSYLFDTALIYPDDSGAIRLADPLIDPVNRVMGRSIAYPSDVAAALEAYLEDFQDEAPPLDLARSLARARRMAGKTDPSAFEIQFTSDLIEVARQAYHKREHEKAVQYAREALDSQPENLEARRYLARGLAQLEKFQQAQNESDYIRRLGYVKESSFIDGFILRKSEHWSDAIRSYREAISRGWHGVAVHRELAQCFFKLNDLESAREHIDEAQKIDYENRYLVDLQAQIAVSQGDEARARKSLDILRVVDTEPFYEHRKSTIEYHFSSKEEAYKSAYKAFELVEKPPFPFWVQLIKTEIETRRLDDAQEHLNSMERIFRNVKSNIRIGLHIKWEVANGTPENGVAYAQRLREPLNDIETLIYSDALENALEMDRLSGEQKHFAQQELEDLHTRLIHVTARDAIARERDEVFWIE